MEPLRTEVTTTKYVIIAARGGKMKYVGRNYSPKMDYGYTVKLNGAMMFDTEELARRRMDWLGVNGMIGKVQKHLELVEVI